MNKIIERHKLPITALTADEIIDGKYRCEARVYRKKNGICRYDLPKKRCIKPALNNEQYCHKHLKKLAKRNSSQSTEYDDFLPKEISKAAEIWANLPQVADLKPEIVTLRGILANYMKHSKSVESLAPSKMLESAAEIINKHNNGFINSTKAVKELRDVFIHGSLCDPIILTEVRKTISMIKQLADSIFRTEKESKFMLDYGQAMMLIKNLQNILKDRIEDKNVLRTIVDDIKRMPSLIDKTGVAS